MTLQQQVARLLAEVGVADHQRHDMRRIFHHRQAGGGQRVLGQRRLTLMPGALFARRLQMPDGRAGARRDGRGQGRREDEGRREGAHGVDDVGLGGDIAAQRAKPLGQRALDDIDLVHDAFALADAAAARAVHANRVDFVDIGERVVLPGEFGDPRDGGDVAIHRIETLEHHQFGAVARRLQQFLEMLHVVVTEQHLLAARAANALDHRVMVERVRNDQAVRQQLGDGGNRREIGNPAGGEGERRFLVVQIGQLGLKLHDGMMRARNVARAAGARAMPPGRVDHGLDHLVVAAHGQIVI